MQKYVPIISNLARGFVSIAIVYATFPYHKKPAATEDENNIANKHG